MGRNHLFKLIWIFIILIITYYHSPGNAVQKYSFRMRSLGPNLSGFVDDLYSDLYYNPAYIYRFNKHYIYTNLSNMQGAGQTQLFGDENSAINQNGVFPSNLIGYAGPVRNKPWGVFWESSGHSFELIDTNQEDNSPQGTGFKGTTSRNLKGSFSGQGLSLFGMMKGIGFNITYDRVGMDLTWNSSQDSLFHSSIDTSRTTHKSDQGQWKFPNSFLAASIGKVWRARDHEWSVSGGIQPHRINLDMDQLFNLVQVNLGEAIRVFREPFDGGATDTSSMVKPQDLGFAELGVRSYFARARYKQIRILPNSFYQVNYLFDFNRYSLPIELTNTTEIRQDTLTIATKTKTNYKQNDIVPGSGKTSINNLTFGIGGESHFDNLKSMVSLGVKFSYLWGKLNINQGPGRRIITNKKMIDTVIVGNNTYSQTISNKKYIQTTGDTRWLVISLPVGLELRPVKQIVMRLGANTTLPIQFKGNWNITTRDSANVVVDTTGAAPPFASPPETPATKKTKSQLKGKLISLTSYYYGVSFKVTPSIDIDLMNFAEVTNLRQWWLSVVIRY